MLRYSTKDIIARAEQLADLQNSDFIGTDEKIALLNENFQILYQKIIDSNDRTWLKSVYIQDGMELPADFYQLARVYDENSNRDINKSTGRDKLGYDIKNNIITLHANGNIVMDYYPEPPTLGLKTVETTDEYNPTIDGNIIGINKKLIVTNENGYIKVRVNSLSDNYPILKTSNGANVEQQVSYRSYGAVFDNLVMCINPTANTTTTAYSFIMSYFERNNPTSVTKLVQSNSEILYVSDNKATAVNVNSSITKSRLGIDSIDENTYIMYQCGNYLYEITAACDFYYVVNGNKIYIPELNVLKDPDFFMPQMFPDGNNLVVYSSSKVVVLKPEGYEIVNSIHDLKHLINNKEMLVYNDVNSTLAIESVMDDTLLSYPNNAYYTMLAYLLAVSFKMKQNGDPSNLINKYSSIENQFFDSINRDVNESYIMNDVYKSGPLVW